MTNDNPPPTPALTLSDKLMAMNHLTTFVPEKLDVDAMNYSSWVYYFSHLCHGYGILDHLVDPVASSSTTTPTDPPPKDAEWTKIDFIIRSWIFSTLAPSLRKRLVDLNPTTAKDAWTYIEAIFQDNKRPRAMALKAELRNLKLGDLSIDGYFQKIESIVSVLNGLGSPLSNDDVVTFALEGLPSTYETISTVIVSREPFPDLKTVRSLLTTHEMRLKSRVQNPLVDATSASPMVLLAKSNTSARRGPSLEKVNNPCWSFAKGSCRFGDACKYLHNGVHGKSTLLPRTSGSASSVPGVTRSDLDMLQSLLAKFGLNAPNISTPSPPVAYTVSVPPGFQSVSAQLSAQPTYVSPQLLPGSFGVSNMGMAGLFPQGVQYPTGSPQQGVHYPQQGVQTLSGPPQGVHLVPGTSQPPIQFTTGVQQQQGGSFPGSVHLGQSPSMPFHPSQLFASGSQGSGQATLLPNAFNTTTLQEPASGNWNMDTGASSHLNDSVHCLSDILNMCIYPSVAVGDGRFIPVTNSGHSVLSTPFRPLRLNNVLITPNIVKNLISVRQFVRDNSCTVEFDPFGFSVKDFITRRVLLRCDSTGELYPVTKPSTIPHAFLTSQYTWHQRLGHPGSEVLRRLVSSDSISCNKEKLPVLCHACQLGKHVKLPFVSSSSSVTSCFDIVHSDLWTSPIPSLSGFQYYVLFLDHYSQYVWVYPLMNKSDVLSKFLLFRNYVRTQFKCEIKSFQCDHGGEFDNHAFHKLFNDNGIQFRFSCPRTSQQNGKSERMIRTINNLIRTLLFQAHLPPNYWTEALNMAVYLLNILPSRAINNEIPFTRLFGAQPDYSVLRVFGCLCYPHIDTNHKLGPRATPSIFLGHAANHFGYRCLDLNTNKIIISRHVTFDETVFPFPSTKSTTTPSYDFLDDSTDLISTIIRTAPITPVPAPVHTPLVDVPTPPTPPTPSTHLCLSLCPKLYLNMHPLPLMIHQPCQFIPWVTRSVLGLLSYHRTMFLADGTLSRYNARLVANGSTQVEGVDVDETFSPGVRRALFGYRVMTTAFLFNFSMWDDNVLYASSDRFMFLSQRKYAMEILERDHMVGCNSSRTPVDTESKLGDGGTPVVNPTLYRSLAGSLQYLTFTRPDITIFNLILIFLIAYSDADWAGCPTTRRSTSGYCVFLGNNLLSWSSKRQPTLSRSSAEAEYRGVANAVSETCWIRNLLRELHTPLSSATIVYCDNVSVVYLSSNPVQHQRTKHIEIDIHFVRDLVATRQVRVLHVPSRFQYANIFTKGLPSALFDEFRDSLSVRCTPAPTVGEC
ncbi:ribonuclease H-like domain-containing protein [Tanacetum coccineum]